MSTVKRCSTCGTEGYGMKWCGKCKATFYCSRECQTRDWKQHKKNCIPRPVTAASGSESGTACHGGSKSGTASDRKHGTASGSKSGTASDSTAFHIFDHVAGRLTVQKGNHLLQSVDDSKVELLPMELQFLVDKVKSSLPSSPNFFRLPSGTELRFVTNFGQIQFDSEADCDPAWTWTTVLLAKIVELDVYQFRHGIFISDENYSRLVVYFHNETPVWPYFKWNQLKPGNFICIQGPGLHFFRDGQTGFRVDNPGTVRILSRQGICLSGK